jgi:prevent-host-death family protein
MRSVSIKELEEHTAELVAEVEAGNPLTLIRSGRAVAAVIPIANTAAHPTEAARSAARARLIALMEQGINLGGLRVNRDELYSSD